MNDGRSLSVIGVGNPDCGDDAFGWLAVERFEMLYPGIADTRRSRGEPAGLVEILSGCDNVVLVDAISSQGSLGSVHCFDVSEKPLPIDLFANYSTHGVGLNEGIELARALGEMPARVVVIGVEGERFEPGDRMSTDVERAVDPVVKRIYDEIDVLKKSKPNDDHA